MWKIVRLTEQEQQFLADCIQFANDIDNRDSFIDRFGEIEVDNVTELEDKILY